MRQTTLSPATDGDRGPFPTYGHYAWMMRNFLTNFVPSKATRIVLDVSKTPAFGFYDADNNEIPSPLDDADQRSMPMFLSSCRAVVNGPPFIAPFRKILRWVRAEGYNVEILVASDGENAETAIWQLHVVDSIAEFIRRDESANGK